MGSLDGGSESMGDCSASVLSMGELSGNSLSYSSSASDSAYAVPESKFMAASSGELLSHGWPARV